MEGSGRGGGDEAATDAAAATEGPLIGDRPPSFCKQLAVLLKKRWTCMRRDKKALLSQQVRPYIHISPLSRLYLPSVSPISPLYLAYISPSFPRCSPLRWWGW